MKTSQIRKKITLHGPFLYAVIFLIVCICSCKKDVTVDAPQNSLNSANVYSTDATAIAAMTSIYKTMTTAGRGYVGNSAISEICGLSADEFTLYSGVTNFPLKSYYKNALIQIASSSAAGAETWSVQWTNIYTCNAVIEGITASTALTPAVKQQLLGEAKFMRAWFFFYLVNLYGDVPLTITTDYKVNSTLPRAAKADVYTQIIADLRSAQALLNSNYVDASLIAPTTDRIRPNKAAATALLARAYLYIGNWAGADSAATAVISNPLYALSPLSGSNRVFVKNSSEAIWQLQPTMTGHNTEDGWSFVLPATGPSNPNGTTGFPVYLSNALLNSFEAGDQRRSNWVNSVTVTGGTTYYYPYKYQSATLNASVTEYEMVLRLGEQYLIRAEARAQAGSNIAGAQQDLNTIRNRASLLSVTPTGTSLLSAIYHERQVELFSEWGHRWLDLKRTGTVDAVMGPPGNACAAKGGTWASYQQLYPLLLGDLQKDIYLKQNPGY